MATIGLAHTLNDLRKTMNPDGSVDRVLEILAQDNPILEDCPFMEGNLPTGNKTTVRASLPTPSIRRINRGVDATKGTNKQISDTAMILEDRSEVDIELLSLAPNPEAYRNAEDDAHVEGMAQYVASVMLYGDNNADPDLFTGFMPRYNTLAGGVGTPGYQTVSAGTANSGAKNTSLLFVDWGDRRVTGIYPRGSQAGLKVRDLGENDAIDKDGKKFRAVSTLYNWKVGLAVHNLRSVARIANIDTVALQTMTAADQTKLMDKIIVAKNRIWKPQRPVIYCSETMYTFFEQYLSHKDNFYITRQELMGQMPTLAFAGIPIKKVDCFTDTEAAVQ